VPGAVSRLDTKSNRDVFRVGIHPGDGCHFRHQTQQTKNCYPDSSERVTFGSDTRKLRTYTGCSRQILLISASLRRLNNRKRGDLRIGQNRHSGAADIHGREMLGASKPLRFRGQTILDNH
jgi:hypothetical protein